MFLHYPIRFIMIAFLASSFVMLRGVAQDHVTIRGKLTTQQVPFEFDLKQLDVKLQQQIQFEPLPFPDNWQQMKRNERQAWLTRFWQTEKGKALRAEREQRLAERAQFDVKIKSDGSFVVFDVPQGTYTIRGSIDRKSEDKKFALEVFGQFDVGDVDEIQLNEIPVTATRILQQGERAPEFSLASVEHPERNIKLASFRDQYVLVTFWSAQSTPSKRDMIDLTDLRKKLRQDSIPIEFLGVCLDDDRRAALDFLKENEIEWPQAMAGGWHGSAASAFGVRGIPYYCLIDGAGNVQINHQRFVQLLRSGETDRASILKEACK